VGWDEWTGIATIHTRSSAVRQITTRFYGRGLQESITARLRTWSPRPTHDPTECACVVGPAFASHVTRQGMEAASCISDMLLSDRGVVPPCRC
jgi:hypothetical protein